MTNDFHFIDCGNGKKVVAVKSDDVWWLNGSDVCRIMNIGCKSNGTSYSVKRVIRHIEGMKAFSMLVGPSSVTAPRMCSWVDVNSVHRLEVHCGGWKDNRIKEWRAAYSDRIIPFIETFEKEVEVERATTISSIEDRLKQSLSGFKDVLSEIIEENRALKEQVAKEKLTLSGPQTISKWLAVNDLTTDMGVAQSLGKSTSKLCREKGVEIVKIDEVVLSKKKPKIRTSNAYPPDLIQEAAVKLLMELA